MRALLSSLAALGVIQTSKAVDDDGAIGDEGEVPTTAVQLEVSSNVGSPCRSGSPGPRLAMLQVNPEVMPAVSEPTESVEPASKGTPNRCSSMSGASPPLGSR